MAALWLIIAFLLVVGIMKTVPQCVLVAIVVMVGMGKNVPTLRPATQKYFWSI
jgi:MFS superfamily sulfate permease-like transporter